MRKVYRLRKTVSGEATGRSTSYTVGVPEEIAQRLVAKGFEMFVVELTTEGILYKPINAIPTETLDLPEWLK